MDPELQKNVKLLVKLAILVLSLLALFLIVNYLFPYFGKVFARLPSLLLPFIIALAIALIVEPVVVFFETKLRMKRSWAVLASLLLFLGAIFSILVLLISKISNELVRLSPAIGSYSGDIGKIAIDAISNLRLFYLQMELPPEVQQTIQSHWESGILLITSLLNDIIAACIHLLSQLPNMMIVILISTIATFFLVKDRAVIRRFFWRFLPRQTRVKSMRVVNELIKSLVGFVKAYSILVSITAIVTMIALKILGVQYAFTIGLITGILDLLPVVGPGVVFIPWVIWELFLGSRSLGIGLLVVYVIISVVRQILEPKITGDNIGLHPLATLLSMYVGLKLLGFAGVILGPVTLVVVLAINRAGFFNSIKWRR